MFGVTYLEAECLLLVMTSTVFGVLLNLYTDRVEPSVYGQYIMTFTGFLLPLTLSMSAGRQMSSLLSFKKYLDSLENAREWMSQLDKGANTRLRWVKAVPYIAKHHLRGNFKYERVKTDLDGLLDHTKLKRLPKDDRMPFLHQSLVKTAQEYVRDNPNTPIKMEVLHSVRRVRSCWTQVQVNESAGSTPVPYVVILVVLIFGDTFYIARTQKWWGWAFLYAIVTSCIFSAAQLVAQPFRVHSYVIDKASKLTRGAVHALEKFHYYP